MNVIPPKLESRFHKVAEQTKYPVDALLFVLNGFSPTSIMSLERIHINAAELCWRLHDQAIARYGTAAREQLKSWGIESTIDFGQIVFGLISEGLMLQNDDDQIEDFRDVFDFENEFEKFRNPPPQSIIQWRLSSLFVITTIAAVALPGALSFGVSGVFGTVFASWIILVGGFLLISGIRDSSKGQLLTIIVGAICLAAGIIAFVTISTLTPAR